MNIEQENFANYLFVEEKLVAYGFQPDLDQDNEIQKLIDRSYESL